MEPRFVIFIRAIMSMCIMWKAVAAAGINVKEGAGMEILGYPRKDGSCGIRNHLVIMAASACASETVRKIAEIVQGAVPLTHQHGCCQAGDDLALSINTLIALGKNPNVGAVLVVGLGCEGIHAAHLAGEIGKAGKPAASLIIQEQGGTLGALHEGARLACGMANELSAQARRPFPISEIIMSLECGGSDPTSGLTANPVIGECSNLLIAKGGSSVLSETTEMIGAEHILAQRAVSKEIGGRFLEVVKNTEKKALEMGHDLRGTQPTPGNIASGISTIEEKSLGCIYKSGNTPLLGVVDYACEIPRQPRGLYFMDTPGEDLCSVTGMVAGGSQIVIFSTGLGTPTGHPIAPVIKLTGNDATYRKMTDNIDFNAGTVITQGETIAARGQELFDLVVSVCNGKLTKAEILGHREFGLYRIGNTF